MGDNNKITEKTKRYSFMGDTERIKSQNDDIIKDYVLFAHFEVKLFV